MIIIHVESETTKMFILLSSSQNPKKNVKENSHTAIPDLLMEGTVSYD